MPIPTRSPFATDKDDKLLYVNVHFSGINPQVVAYDAIEITLFKSDSTVYIKVSDAIAWHEKKLKESSGQSGNELILNSLRKILERFESGDWKTEEGN